MSKNKNKKQQSQQPQQGEDTMTDTSSQDVTATQEGANAPISDESPASIFGRGMTSALNEQPAADAKPDEIVASTDADADTQAPAADAAASSEPQVATPAAAPVAPVQPDAGVPNTTAKKAEAPVRSNAAPDDATLNTYLDDYLEAYKKSRTSLADSGENRKVSLMHFKNIINFLKRYPSVDLFERAVKFFRVNRHLLGMREALIGIHDLDDNDSNKLSAMRDIFDQLTSGKVVTTKSINMDNLAVMLNDPKLVQVISTYLIKLAR